VHFDLSFPVPIISVHSSNSARKLSMMQAIGKLEIIRQRQLAGA
jgi:hypothetical protein